MFNDDKAATSSQPGKSKESRAQNPRQSRDGRVQSPSMGPVANPQMAEYSSKYVGSSNQGERVGRHERKVPIEPQHIIGGSSQAKRPQRNHD